MARNEDGEFELILGNRQLMSVFFLVVVLLGLCFLIGYVFGRNSAPVLNADTVAPAEESVQPRVIPPPEQEPATDTAKAEDPARPPSQTAPQQTAEAAPPPAAPKQTVARTAPGQTAKAAPAAGSSQPVPGRTYLQLSATGRDQAEAMVDLLRARNFAALAAQIPERPDTYRVLVGPLEDSAVSRTRADLKAANFPGDDAITKKF